MRRHRSGTYPIVPQGCPFDDGLHRGSALTALGTTLDMTMVSTQTAEALGTRNLFLTDYTASCRDQASHRFKLNGPAL